MTYVDYSFYKDTYRGNIPQDVFNKLSIKASKYIDYVTFNRIDKVTEDIKLATCEVIDILYESSKKGDMEIKSETSGKYSISYADTNKTVDQKKYEVVKAYLGHTGLLYRGV